LRTVSKGNQLKALPPARFFMSRQQAIPNFPKESRTRCAMLLRYGNRHADFLIDFPLPRFRRRFGRFGSTRTLLLLGIVSRSKPIGRRIRQTV